MDNARLTLGGIMNAGVLATSLVMGVEPTYATTLEQERRIYSENPYEIVAGNYHDYLKTTASFSSQYDMIKIGVDVDEDDCPEANVIEVPVVKKMVFQFKRPIKLEFS